MQSSHFIITRLEPAMDCLVDGKSQLLDLALDLPRWKAVRLMRYVAEIHERQEAIYRLLS